MTKYQIRYRKKGSSAWTVKTVSSSRSSLTIKKITTTKKIQIQVRAYKIVSGKYYCGSRSSIKTAYSRYDRVIKVNGTKKRLSTTSGTWSKSGGYKYCTIKSTGKKTVTVSGYKKKSTYATSLKAGKTYYVRIRTYKTVSGKKYYSSWSDEKNNKKSQAGWFPPPGRVSPPVSRRYFFCDVPCGL